ncbi:hypothetical protein ROJ8625_03883 [Roseivivax jejudonensis]|uniref:Uncharacterized protein n=1 Tax=Roseivivax jejudonensis TaxID=1529041 RepID=A0A1X7A7U3_9RHOB|nr:hypothetical protein [Roseivivax jejudonensis]SLN72793.1 hypothetical protein ROJ8625_03883 [Roseivivax jejudonensis]
MQRTVVRKLQLACFGLVHVPLAAVAAFGLPAEAYELVGVAFVTTLGTALMVWGIIERLLASAARPA